MQGQLLLELKALEVGYDGSAILPAVTLQVAREELWALVGRNGGGKTTLLRTILGLMPRLHGEVIRTPGVNVGYVPQRSELDLSVPMRVRDVVAQGIDAGWSFLRPGLIRRSSDRIAHVLDEVGMSSLSRQSFTALSDGQRQRVLLARALVSDPDLLILDEPTNGMDLAAERAAFELFTRLQSSRHMALIIVSHHMMMLAHRASHVLWVDKDENRVLSGDIDEVQRDSDFIVHYGTVFGTVFGTGLSAGDKKGTTTELKTEIHETQARATGRPDE